MEDAVRILHVTIGLPFDRVYAFAHRPENFPKWASGMATSLHRSGDGWVAETPEGRAEVRFTEPNAYGILDHRVLIEGKPEIYVPLRLTEHGDDTLVALTLFRQPDMDDGGFARDAALVTADLEALKALLEAG